MMEEKTLNKLEFYTVLQNVADFATSKSAKNVVMTLNPVGDFALVNRLLSETSEAFWLINQNVIPSFDFDDITEALKKAKIYSSLTLRELLAVKRLLRTSRLCVLMLDEVDESKISYLKIYAQGMYQNFSFEERLDKCIVNEDELADSASAELYALRQKIKKTNFDIREKLNSFIRSSTTAKYLQDAIVTMKNDRYVLPVKQEYKSNVQGLIHDQSASGATVFIEPISVVNLNNQLKELILAEKEEIERIIADFTQNVSDIADHLSRTQETIAYVDSVYAKAFYSERLKANLPLVNQKGYVFIKNGRHPLIDSKKVVPITIKFGDINRQVIVTGPNTGGKTVSIKTVGLFCLMTYVGLYLPASEGTEIPIFDDIYCDIGDEQSIEQNLSTFSSHIKNLNYILNSITAESLVLADEIGAGTEPIEGSALALAVCRYLLDSNARSVITTHYSQLKEYSITTSNVVSASMEFDTKTFEPTYKLVMGVPGNSNALEIALRLGMKEEIVSDAFNRVDENKKSFDRVLKNAEELRQQYEKLIVESEELKRQTVEEYQKAKNQNALLVAEREKLLAGSRTEAKRIVSAAREESSALLEQLKALFKKQTIEENSLFAARSIVKKLNDKKYEDESEDNDVFFEGSPIDINTLQLGDKVFIKKLKTVGTVSSLPKSGKIQVKFNNMVTMLKQGEAYSYVDVTPQKQKVTTPKTTVTTKGFSFEINVIGQTVDEAMYDVEKFIDDAIMRNASEVRIIHGRGTGKLKAAIHQYLKSNRNVSEYRLGDYNEGNGGVTIVKFK